MGAAALLLLSACGSGDASSESNESTVRIAAASDLTFAMPEIERGLREEHPEIDLAVTFGSSGTFLQQLTNGAPFDMFLSADLSYPQQLVESGLADADDLFPYAVGRLAIWVPNDSDLDVEQGLGVLADPYISTVAIANPEHAPYGKAAIAAMTSAGVIDAVEPKVVLGENVAQAAEFVMSGNADVGVIALSLALSPRMSEAGRHVEVPLDSYPRLDQGGVVMGSAEDISAARIVRDFLISDEGKHILQRFGFSWPED